VRTAFLALDFATYIVENFSHDAAVAERASSALASARAAGLHRGAFLVLAAG
jgi:hypothetical protein